MKNIYILNCTGDISTCCSDYGLASSLAIVKKVITLIQIVVPILLIIMVAIQLIKMMANPDDKKGTKSLINKFIAAVVVFFLPTIVNIVISWMPTSFELASCWKSGDELNEISKATHSDYISSNKKKSYSILNNPNDYDPGDEKSSGTTTTGESTGDGSILLIAGHSYPPYCNNFDNECRGIFATSGYDETDQTRVLVKLIKNELDNLGVKTDIANALMSGDNDTMNKSFYGECSTNSALFNQFNWTKYSYALEIHFNGSGDHTASGPVILMEPGATASKADQAILNAITKNTNIEGHPSRTQHTADGAYFRNNGVPFTYLETEFYDNKIAMDKYYSQKEQIAKDIAQAIKQNYG